MNLVSRYWWVLAVAVAYAVYEANKKTGATVTVGLPVFVKPNPIVY